MNKKAILSMWVIYLLGTVLLAGSIIYYEYGSEYDQGLTQLISYQRELHQYDDLIVSINNYYHYHNNIDLDVKDNKVIIASNFSRKQNYTTGIDEYLDEYDYDQNLDINDTIQFLPSETFLTIRPYLINISNITNLEAVKIFYNASEDIKIATSQYSPCKKQDSTPEKFIQIQIFNGTTINNENCYLSQSETLNFNKLKINGKDDTIEITSTKDVFYNITLSFSQEQTKAVFPNCKIVSDNMEFTCDIYFDFIKD